MNTETPGPHIVNIDTAPELSDAEEEPGTIRTKSAPNPDNGKVFVRALDRVGRFEATEYMEGEATEPRILVLAREII